MDPTVTLRTIREQAANLSTIAAPTDFLGALDELTIAIDDLRTWVAQGGYVPVDSF